MCHVNDVIIQTEKLKGQPLFVLTEICSVGQRLPDFEMKQVVYAHHQTTLKLSYYETIECLLHSLWQLHKQYNKQIFLQYSMHFGHLCIVH